MEREGERVERKREIEERESARYLQYSFVHVPHLGRYVFVAIEHIFVDPKELKI